LTTGYRASPFQILPVLAALALAGVLTYGLQASKAEIAPITVFPETPSGVTLNALIFVVMMAVAATMIYLLLRFRRKSIVRYMIMGAMFFVTFFLLNWYSEAYVAYFAPVVNVYDYWWIALTVIASGFLMLGLYKGSSTARLLAVTVVGSLTGTFLGTSIPALTAIVLLAALAVYDLVSVYRGPIGKIAEMTDLEDFQGAVFTVGDLTIGMGDLVFYSMLVSTAMMNLGTLAYVGAFLGVAIGSFLGFKLLERREILPGLPLAIGIGLAAMFIASQLQGWLHF